MADVRRNRAKPVQPQEPVQIVMGQKVRDELTGYTGIVTGRAEYLTGCERVLVQPTFCKDGDLVEGAWIDIDRVVPVRGAKLFVLSRRTSNGPGLVPPAGRRAPTR